MKLLICDECHDTIALTHDNITRICRCGVTAGKYLEDKVTAIVTGAAVIFGIDNNSFSNALATIKRLDREDIEGFDKDTRYDFFFTGWIPTIPGEVVFVHNVDEVLHYDYHTQLNWTSQNPSTDINEK